MSEFDFDDIRRLDGGLLLVFRELLRRGRASEVATHLGLSPSAVSHALARLRDLYNDPLFIRRPHGLQPTRRALELGPRIEALIEMAGATLTRPGGFDPYQSDRRFILSAPEFVTALIGGPLLTSFAMAAPQASFVAASLGPEVALEGLRRGDVDLAIGRFPEARPGIERLPLYEDQHCVVARRGHPRIKGAIDAETWSREGVILATSPGEVGDDILLPSPAAVRVLAMVPRWLTALALVSSTDALASCPRRLAERQAGVLGLQVIKAPFEDHLWEVSAMRRAGQDDGGVDWLIEQVRSAVG